MRRTRSEPSGKRTAVADSLGPGGMPVVARAAVAPERRLTDRTELTYLGAGAAGVWGKEAVGLPQLSNTILRGRSRETSSGRRQCIRQWVTWGGGARVAQGAAHSLLRTRPPVPFARVLVRPQKSSTSLLPSISTTEEPQRPPARAAPVSGTHSQRPPAQGS